MMDFEKFEKLPPNTQQLVIIGITIILLGICSCTAVTEYARYQHFSETDKAFWKRK